MSNHPSTLLKSYVFGFISSIILTSLAFVVVERKLCATPCLYVAVVMLGLVQLVVQVICFLRLNARTEDDRWSLVAFLFTLLIMGIIVTGSLWIMYNLNYFMMN